MPATSDSAAISRLETTVEAMVTQQTRLIGTVEKMAEKMDRLAILEERHSTTSDALERAFNALATHKSEAAAFQAEIRTKHSSYDRVIWVAVGFCSALSLVWGAITYQLNMSLNESRERMQRFEAHLLQDKVITPEDVRRIVEVPAHGG